MGMRWPQPKRLFDLALLACWLPGRRAAWINPLVALGPE